MNENRMFEIIVTEIFEEGSDPEKKIERYRQVVEMLSLPAVIKAVNSIPRGRPPGRKAKE